PYAFAANDPVNRSDPRGLCPTGQDTDDGRPCEDPEDDLQPVAYGPIQLPPTLTILDPSLPRGWLAPLKPGERPLLDSEIRAAIKGDDTRTGCGFLNDGCDHPIDQSKPPDMHYVVLQLMVDDPDAVFGYPDMALNAAVVWQRCHSGGCGEYGWLYQDLAV